MINDDFLGRAVIREMRMREADYAELANEYRELEAAYATLLFQVKGYHALLLWLLSSKAITPTVYQELAARLPRLPDAA